MSFGIANIFPLRPRSNASWFVTSLANSLALRARECVMLKKRVQTRQRMERP